MKKFIKFLRKPVVLVVLGVILLGGTALAYWNNNKTPSYVDKPQTVSADEVKQTETAAQNSDSSSQTSDSQNLPVIAKPMLSKSSGNAAPVPSGANIQFTCSGINDSSCVITLTNQNNSSENLKFDAKTIKDDGHGNLAVTWIWEAKAGTWTVKATLSKSGYQPNSSDPQTLTVNP